MFISEETQNLVSELKEFSNSKLKNINDLSILIEASKIFRKEKLFDGIIFTAKYLNGLGRILQGNINPGIKQEIKLNGNKQRPISEDAMEKIKQEYKKNLGKLSDNLNELIQDVEESERTEFIGKYLSLTRESMLNLSTLIYDLTWLKKFQNRRK